MDETDKAFIERVGADPEGANGADYVRLFNLARRGAAIPDEPTKKMIEAGNYTGDWGYKEESSWCRQNGNPDEIYRAMIKTALKEVK